MSDAMGDRNDPTTGEPIEATDRHDDGTEEARLPEVSAEQAPEDDQQADAVADEAEPEAPGDEANETGQSVTEPEPGPDAAETADAEPVAETAERTEPDTAVYELDDDAPSAGSADTAEPAPGAAAEAAAPSGGAASATEPEDEAATEPAASGADAPSGGAAATDPDPAAADTDVIGSEGAAEPDYAALAAELEEFEARQGGAAGAATPAHTAPTTVGSGWFEEAPETFKATEPDDAPTEVVEPVQEAPPAVVPNEPTAHAAPAPEAVITESYEPPRKRGNRVAALLIGVPATIAFTILYAVVDLAYGWFQNEVALESLVDGLLERISDSAFWVPVVVFFLAFWLVGVIVNRGRAGWWVVLGFLVAAVSYAGFVAAPVLTYPFWMITPSAANEQMLSLLLNPVAIGVFIIAREVTVWFGAWVAGRGRKMKRLNADDRAEYETAVAEDQ